MRDVKTISVFGAGKMGTGIAQMFATGGYRVYLWAFDEAEQKRAEGVVSDNLRLVAENDMIEASAVDGIKERITITTDWDLCAKEADLVVESILEKMDLKQDFFKRIDAVTDTDVILCTNTSVMSITEIASTSEHRERIVGTHFWNPPFIVPLVEVVKTEHVADGIAEKVCEVLTSAGKKPIIAKKDVPGFIANRMQNALAREAVSIIDRGIAEPKDVDIACKYSFGMRLGAIGPIEQMDSIGTDLAYNIGAYVYPHLEDSHEVPGVLKDKVDKGELGFKTGGKGFMNWTEEEMKAFQENSIRNIIAVGKALNMF